MLRTFLDTLGGLYELARLGVLTRFQFKGPYWTWRLHTAFGNGMPSSKREVVSSILSYARWVHRMRRDSAGIH